MIQSKKRSNDEEYENSDSRPLKKSCGKNINDTVSNNEVYSKEEVEELIAKNDIKLIDGSMRKNIFNSSYENLKASSSCKLTCAICDCSFDQKFISPLKITEKRATSFNSILKEQISIPISLKEYYSVSKWIPALQDALLSIR